MRTIDSPHKITPRNIKLPKIQKSTFLAHPILFSRIIHAMSKLSSIPNVAIDPSGTFKYILVKVTDPASKDSKLIVRGFERCAYHSDILDEVKSIEGGDLEYQPLGGGKIIFEPDNKSLFIYGKSDGYGQADHQKSVNILQEKYPDYSITFSNDSK
jgi:phosphohistidine phosphatase